MENKFHTLEQITAPLLSYANKVIWLGVQLNKMEKERLRAFLYGLDHLIKFDVQCAGTRSRDIIESHALSSIARDQALTREAQDN